MPQPYILSYTFSFLFYCTKFDIWHWNIPLVISTRVAVPLFVSKWARKNLIVFTVLSTKNIKTRKVNLSAFFQSSRFFQDYLNSHSQLNHLYVYPKPNLPGLSFNLIKGWHGFLVVKNFKISKLLIYNNLLKTLGECNFYNLFKRF